MCDKRPKSNQARVLYGVSMLSAQKPDLLHMLQTSYCTLRDL